MRHGALLNRLILRDGAYCLRCGTRESLSVQHRANRGMGGSKLAGRPSNLIVLCIEDNVALEQDAGRAEQARDCGWKLSKFADPSEQPVLDVLERVWFQPTDDWTREHVADVAAPW